MTVNPLVGQLFSLNGAEPTPLPDRVQLGRNTAYLTQEALQGNVISADELSQYGYVGPIDKPAYDLYRQTLVWDGSDYIIADLSQELRDELWAAGQEKLNDEITELLRLADLRLEQLEAAGADASAVTAFKNRVVAAQASSSCPMEVVLPSTALLYFDSDPSIPHPEAYNWCIENWASDIDRGYICNDTGSDFHITNHETYSAYLETHKDDINLYALGTEFQGLVYPVSFVDNLDRSGVVTVELAGDSVGYTYSINGSEPVTMGAADTAITLSGSGEKEITFTALSANGQGRTYTQSFFIQ